MNRKHVATQRPWSVEEITIAAELWHRDIIEVFGDNKVHCDGAKVRTTQLIARRLDRTFAQIHSRYTSYGSTFEGKTGHQRKQAECP